MATGGADRKVKLWDISKGSYNNNNHYCCYYYKMYMHQLIDWILGSYESKGNLVGSNASVMSVDFDTTGNLILGSSNDFASRVWSVNDGRLRVSFNILFISS